MSWDAQINRSTFEQILPGGVIDLHPHTPWDSPHSKHHHNAPAGGHRTATHGRKWKPCEGLLKNHDIRELASDTKANSNFTARPYDTRGLIHYCARWAPLYLFCGSCGCVHFDVVYTYAVYMLRLPTWRVATTSGTGGFAVKIVVRQSYGRSAHDEYGQMNKLHDVSLSNGHWTTTSRKGMLQQAFTAVAHTAINIFRFSRIITHIFVQITRVVHRYQQYRHTTVIQTHRAPGGQLVHT